MKSLDSYDRQKRVSKADVMVYNKSHIDEVDLKVVSTFEETVAHQSTLDRLEQECVHLLNDYDRCLELQKSCFLQTVTDF